MLSSGAEADRFEATATMMMVVLDFVLSELFVSLLLSRSRERGRDLSIPLSSGLAQFFWPTRLKAPKASQSFIAPKQWSSMETAFRSCGLN